MPLFGEFSRSSQDLCESDYDSIKSWDDRLNSPKSGMWICGDRRNVVRGAEEMFCVEHKECPAWNTRIVLLGTHGVSCSEHTEGPPGAQVMSCLEHAECLEHTIYPDWNTESVMIRQVKKFSAVPVSATIHTI